MIDEMDAFDRQLASVVLRRVGPSRPVDDAAIFSAMTATTSLKWRFQSLFSATRFVVAAVVLALFGGFLLVAQPFDRVGVTVPGAETDGLPPVTGPAGNGLIAFSRDGDIYVGDPVTGESEVIVPGEAYWRPAFSPDGTRLAFMRIVDGVESGCDVLVAAADGSDVRDITPDIPRDIAPEGIIPSCISRFAWAPDSRALVVGWTHTVDPLIGIGPGLLDATGAADPVLLPDVTFSYAAISFLRPPDGDRLLTSGGVPALGVLDLDGGEVVDLGELSGLEAMGYEGFVDPAWSPDGSRIAVIAEAGGERHLYVMDADGSDLRSLGTTAWPDDSPGDSPWEWSPDGSMIALQDAALVERSLDACPGETEPICAETTWITLIDVESGEGRVLDATRSPGWGDGTIWSWSWSPDGRAILLGRGSGMQPLPAAVVDVATDTATELPWGIEPPFLSWQRVAAD